MKSRIQTGRRPKNDAEGQFWDFVAKSGWKATKRGWPDFLVETEEGVICVEVKPHSTRKLKKSQEAAIGWLVQFGVPCYKWTPDGGLQVVSGFDDLQPED